MSQCGLRGELRVEDGGAGDFWILWQAGGSAECAAWRGDTREMLLFVGVGPAGTILPSAVKCITRNHFQQRQIACGTAHVPRCWICREFGALEEPCDAAGQH